MENSTQHFCLLLFAYLIGSSVGVGIWPNCELGDQCTSEFPYCPDCSLVDCLPKWTNNNHDCPAGSIFMEKIAFGCCPGCIRYLKPGDICTSTTYERFSTHNLELRCGLDRPLRVKETFSPKGIPIYDVFECGPDSNLGCGADGKCQAKEQCTKDFELYLNWVANVTMNCSINEWRRACTPLGKYDLIQEKANNVTIIHGNFKFCSDPFGTRIFGYSNYDDDTMNCYCSRKVWELRQTLNSASGVQVSGRQDVTLHCESNGNFEQLQCDEGVCWCLDPTTGKPASNVVHEDLVRFLECYDREKVGGMYLRRCESREFGKVKSKAVLQRHGLIWNEPSVSCDYDGSYSSISCDRNGDCSCVDKYNEKLPSVSGGIRELMDCRCARQNDNYKCNTKTGGYQEYQAFPSIFCVDGDGFKKTYSYKDQTCNILGCPEREAMCNTTVGLCKPCEPDCSKIDTSHFREFSFSKFH